MDPSYDKPPGSDYVCAVCHRVGKHWRSLCPRNLDPNCIYQKRKAAGIVRKRDDDDDDNGEERVFSVRTKKFKTGGILENWEKDRDMKPSRRIEEGSPIPIRASNPTSKVINLDAMNVDYDDQVTPAKEPDKAFPDFVQKLILTHPTLADNVNNRKPRPTAADMWEEDDRQHQTMKMEAPGTPDGDGGRLTPYEESPQGFSRERSSTLEADTMEA